MPTEKLYPPQIAGSLPAFYKEYNEVSGISTGAVLEIPFVMNAAVGDAQVKGFALRLKTASSGTYVCPVQFSRNWDKEKSTITFNLDETIAMILQEGQFYKVQIAYYTYKTQLVPNSQGVLVETYIDNSNPEFFTIGYYSTVGVIKCVSKPKVFIEGFSDTSINLFTGTFLGVYDQTQSQDKTEKVYSYRFDFYDSENNFYMTSDELIHNVNEDSEYDYSTDRFICNDFIKVNDVYSIVYTVTTMNGLVMSSPRYKITSNNVLVPYKQLKIVPTLVPDDGYIDISLQGLYEYFAVKKNLGIADDAPEESKWDMNNIYTLYGYSWDEVCPDVTLYKRLSLENKEQLYYGEYILSRASEKDGYVEWIELTQFRLSNEKPSSYHFKDFTVEQGIHYIYAVQQYNMSKLRSSKIYSRYVSIDFEDMFLYDGKRQLKIRFNPKVSSFKTTLLEKKVETIGSKYPFVFRNGKVAYKEFPIEGLISYQMDDSRLFYLEEENPFYARESTDYLFRGTNIPDSYYEAIDNGLPYRPINGIATDLVEDNIVLERKFKLAVLDWLNDGQVKLFKSGTEGNYLVRILDVSLTPTDQLGRMIHTFKAKAVEIAEFNIKNLKKFGFEIGQVISDFVPLWKNYNLIDLPYDLDGIGKVLEFEQEVTSFSLEGLQPGTRVFLYYGGEDIPEEIMIGNTGAYNFSNSDRRVTKLIIVDDLDIILTGSIECQYIGRRYSAFDSITNVSLKTIVSNQFVGVDSLLEKVRYSPLEVSDKAGAQAALNDTNYRIEAHTLGWDDLLKALTLYNENGTLNYDPDFDPGDTIQKIKTDFYNKSKNKLRIINMEQVHLRKRELIPLYVVPYEMVDERAWKLMPDRVIGWSKTDGRYTRAQYESSYFPSYYLPVSTTPFGQPFLLDEIVLPYGVYYDNYYIKSDKFCIFQIFQYKDGKWIPIENERKEGTETFKGSYYDPYYNQLVTDYKTTFYLGSRHRYNPITRNDVYTLEKGNNKYTVLKSNDAIITTDNLYCLKNNQYAKLKDVYNIVPGTENDFPWAHFNGVFYLQGPNEIDLSYRGEYHYDNLGQVDLLSITNGVIAEETFQLEITDYYTEQNDPQTKAAKDRYLEAAAFLRNLPAIFETIQEADVKRRLYGALRKAYNLILKGTRGIDQQLDALSGLDYLILLIMLEYPEVTANQLVNYIQPGLVGSDRQKEQIATNIRTILTKYPTIIPMEEIVYNIFNFSDTMSESNKTTFRILANIFESLYTMLEKKNSLNLNKQYNEEEDVMSVFTKDTLEGLGEKYTKLLELKLNIEDEIARQEEEIKEYKKNISEAQKNIKEGYAAYNKTLREYSTALWLLELYTLNNSQSKYTNKLSIMLKDISKYYSAILSNNQIENDNNASIKDLQADYKEIYLEVERCINNCNIFNNITRDQEGDQELDIYIENTIKENIRQIIVGIQMLQSIEKIQSVIDYGFSKFIAGTDLTSEDSSAKLINRVTTELNTDGSFYKWGIEALSLLNTKASTNAANMVQYYLTHEAPENLNDFICNFIIDVDDIQQMCDYFNGKILSSQQAITYNQVKNNLTNLKNKREAVLAIMPTSVKVTLKRHIFAANSADNTDTTLIRTNEAAYLGSLQTDKDEYLDRISILVKQVDVLLSAYQKSVITDTTTMLNAITIPAIGFVSYTKQKTSTNAAGQSTVVTVQDHSRKAEQLDSYIKTINDNAALINNLLMELLPSLNTKINKNFWDGTLIKQDFTSKYPCEDLKARDRVLKYFNYANAVKEYVLTAGAKTAFNVNALTLSYKDEPLATSTTHTMTDGTHLDLMDYRYFSSYYQNYLGFIDGSDENKSTGVLYWCLKYDKSQELDVNLEVLSEMESLLALYESKISNYSTKLAQYTDNENSFNSIYVSYLNTEFMTYYQQSNANRNYALDRATKEAKDAWNAFIIELNAGYAREVERGMYG